MTVPTIDEVCTSAAAAIDGITGLRAKSYSDSQINEPEVHVFVRDFDPRLVFSVSKKPLPLTARLFIKGIDDRAAHKAIRVFMEPGSVTSKIETITAWTGNGATVDYAEVTLITGPAQIELAGTVRWFVDFEFDVCF